MLVCVYGAGFPGDADLINYYPYTEGVPCSECPTDRFPLCLEEPYTKGSSLRAQDLTFGAGGDDPPHAQLPNLCCKKLYIAS